LSQVGSQILGVKLITTGANSQVWGIDFASIEHLYIIEDLFSFCITGRIRFYDRIGISEFGPLNGAEQIEIMFGNDGDEETGSTPNAKYKKVTMNIQKIEKIDRMNEARPASNDLVELVLVDEYYQKWHSHFWSKSWTDTKISDIITDIAKNHIGIEEFVQFEPTNETIEYFDTHNRTPAECISWLMNRASGSVSGQPGYLFYNGNNTDSDFFGYNFVTLEKLMQNTKWMKPYDSLQKAVYVFENDNPDYINKIRNHKVLNVDLNAIKSLSGGTVLGWDIRRKKLIKQEYTYQDAVNRFTVLGRYTLFPEELQISKPTIKIDGYSDEVILDNIWYGNWVKEYANQQHVHITVDGHTQRKCGGMIRVIWPSHAEGETDSVSYNTESFNKTLDGRFLIKSITHYFDKRLSKGWQQKLVCIKNGYTNSPNPNLIKSVNKNV
jgi:hypothetical protein